MDNIDLWSIQSLIESKTGSIGRLYVPEKDRNFLLDFIIQTPPTIRSGQQRKFDIMIVDQGLPDLFTMTGYSQPVICYHTGYVGKFIKFRNYIMEDPEKNTINKFGTGNLFELLSSSYLQSGSGSYSTMCLLQSIIETPFRVMDKDVYDATDYQLHSSLYHRHLIDEVAFSLLYFGVAHEMGHTYADDCLRSSTKAHSKDITDDAITKAIINSAQIFFDEYPNGKQLFDLWVKEYLSISKDKASALHCENLRTEILADNLGYNILITSLTAFGRHIKQKINFKIFISEVIIGLFTIQLIESCKYLVKEFSAEQLNPKFKSRYFPGSIENLLGIETNQSKHVSLYAQMNAEQLIQDFQISHHVRWEYLKPSLASAAIMHLFPDTYMIKNGQLVSTYSSSELKRREAIALNNVEGYVSFYSKEMLKLQARLGDVLNFAGHMVTNAVPEHRKRSEDENFFQHINESFKIYVDNLIGEEGAHRKEEIYVQLSEQKDLLKSKGKQEDIQFIETLLKRF